MTENKDIRQAWLKERGVQLEAALATARLAVNDWVSCADAEQLQQWRNAQLRLIDAAKRVAWHEAREDRLPVQPTGRKDTE